MDHIIEVECQRGISYWNGVNEDMCDVMMIQFTVQQSQQCESACNTSLLDPLILRLPILQVVDFYYFSISLQKVFFLKLDEFLFGVVPKPDNYR